MRKRGLLFALLAITTFGASQLVATGATTRAGKFRYVEREISVGPRSQSKLEVAWCPRRTHVYGGGVQRLFNDGVLNASFPIDNKDRGKTPDDGWAAYYDNFETSRTVLALRAICGPTMPRYRQSGFIPGAGRYVTRSVTCPRGTFVWGGGASNRGPYNTMYLSETSPVRARKWESTVANVADRRYSAVSYAICGPRRPTYVRSSVGVDGNGALWDADCPTQLHHAIAGGVSHTAPGRMGIQVLTPSDSDGSIDDASDDGFEAEIDNYVSGGKRMTVHAVCLVR
jgi:hypothetical protein